MPEKVPTPAHAKLPAIDVRRLNFSYGTGELKIQVLKDVSLSIYPGEIVILTGPSGSGKTTLLTLIGALRAAEDGTVNVLGKSMVGATEDARVDLRQHIGFIFQQHNLLESLTALQNVCMALELEDNLTENERHYRSTEMLKAVGLGDKLHYMPNALSGGQKQRVSIARALVRNPSIVLADEPTASLDKQSGHDAVEILKNLARERGTTILLVTHDYRILDMADRVVELEDGKILENS
ncbi:MAG: transporter [Rickettsiales bacterium]|jgi:putative ABC transport system ATP-binding protein|nr:transporter [Rickettsiales bacterium]